MIDVVVGRANAITTAAVDDRDTAMEIQWTMAHFCHCFQRRRSRESLWRINPSSDEKCACCNGLFYRVRRDAYLRRDQDMKMRDVFLDLRVHRLQRRKGRQKESLVVD